MWVGSSGASLNGDAVAFLDQTADAQAIGQVRTACGSHVMSKLASGGSRKRKPCPWRAFFWVGPNVRPHSELDARHHGARGAVAKVPTPVIVEGVQRSLESLDDGSNLRMVIRPAQPEFVCIGHGVCEAGCVHPYECAMVKKTTEQKNAEERRYVAASGAANAGELEPFLTDPNQSIRSVAAMNPVADAEILDRFANDKFWGVRMEVVRHSNVSGATLRRLLEPDTRKRGVVHHAARAKLEERGVEFGVDGMPEDAA
jgi:hypothetical protein